MATCSTSCCKTQNSQVRDHQPALRARATASARRPTTLTRGGKERGPLDPLTLLPLPTYPTCAEPSIQVFGFDLLDGMQFIHAKGIICCDLKPANLLLNESGTMKFADFGLAQLLGDINGSGGNSEQARRGTPCYMAPELFQNDGYHSYASDFWSLGCVLYEMAAGSPPFVSTSFRELMNQILQRDFPPISGISKDFEDLLRSLLCKNRLDRIDWPALLHHPFWPSPDGTPQLLPLPRQARFDADLKVRREAEVDMPKMLKRKGGGEVDVLRLSRAANTNLATEIDQAQASYREQQRGGGGGGGGDVQLQNPNMELNFDERSRSEQQAGQEEAELEEQIDVEEEVAVVWCRHHSQACPLTLTLLLADESRGPLRFLPVHRLYQVDDDSGDEEIDEEDELLASRGMDGSAQPTRVAPSPSAKSAPAPAPAPGRQPAAVQPAAVQTAAVQTAAVQTAAVQPAAVQPALPPGVALQPADARQLPEEALEEVLYHSTDSSVKPIVMNRRIEKNIEVVNFEPRSLPFQQVTAIGRCPPAAELTSNSFTEWLNTECVSFYCNVCNVSIALLCSARWPRC